MYWFFKKPDQNPYVFKAMQCNPYDDVNSPLFGPPLADMAEAMSLEGDNEPRIFFFLCYPNLHCDKT